MHTRSLSPSRAVTPQSCLLCSAARNRNSDSWIILDVFTARILALSLYLLLVALSWGLVGLLFALALPLAARVDASTYLRRRVRLVSGPARQHSAIAEIGEIGRAYDVVPLFLHAQIRCLRAWDGPIAVDGARREA